MNYCGAPEAGGSQLRAFDISLLSFDFWVFSLLHAERLQARRRKRSDLAFPILGSRQHSCTFPAYTPALHIQGVINTRISHGKDMLKASCAWRLGNAPTCRSLVSCWRGSSTTVRMMP